MLYKSLWLFIMSVASIFEYIRHTIENLYYYFKYSHPLRNFNGPKEILLLEEHKKNLTKIPKHLSVVVGLDKVDPKILSKIVVFALVADIEYISFYDINGELSLDDITAPQNVNSHKVHDGKFIWSIPGRKQNSRQLKYKNGMEKSIEVSYITVNEGKPLLAKICKELFQANAIKTNEEKIRNKNELTKVIEESLQNKLHNLPSVDLAIIFGKSLCTFGLLPWHTRFTEFHYVKNEKGFYVHEFVNILYKYSKCEQRFGK